VYSIIITIIVALILPTPVLAGERNVTVPTPKSITLVCSDRVSPGTVVLSNPLKFSCKDYETIKSVVGLGITIGPDTKIQEISHAINRANRKNKRENRVASVTRKGNTETYNMKNGNTTPASKQEIDWARDLDRIRRDDERAQWKPFIEDEYNRFDGVSRNKKFFR